MKKRVTAYVDEGFPIPKDGVWIPDEIFSKIEEYAPRGCVDILVRRGRRLFLAPRIDWPVPGWWMIGGGIKKGMTIEEAACQHFTQDTGFDLEPKRLRLLGNFTYMFRRREEPFKKDRLLHAIGMTYIFEPTRDELDFLLGLPLLNTKEYNGFFRDFTRRELEQAVQEGHAHRAILMALNAALPRLI